MVMIETHGHENYRTESQDEHLEYLVRQVLLWGNAKPVVMLTPAFNWCVHITYVSGQYKAHHRRMNPSASDFIVTGVVPNRCGTSHPQQVTHVAE